jgi:hypothetical protein
VRKWHELHCGGVCLSTSNRDGDLTRDENIKEKISREIKDEVRKCQVFHQDLALNVTLSCDQVH